MINITWDNIIQPLEDNLGINFIHIYSEEVRSQVKSGVKKNF